MQRTTSIVFASIAVLSQASILMAQSGRADLDRDGRVDLFDYMEFERLFNQNHRRADFNGDGTLDPADYLEFQRAFEFPETDTVTRKLYLGVGNHWVDTVADGSTAWSEAHDFGPTEMNYRWFTQTVLQIRSGASYADGTNKKFAWVDATSTPTLKIKDGSTELSGQAAYGHWLTKAKAQIDLNLADDPLSNGRWFQLDNETLHFSGYYWGRFMQARAHIPEYSSQSAIETHSTAIIPFGKNFINDLRAHSAFGNLDKFGWYNLPAARNSQTATTDSPWRGDAYLPTFVPHPGAGTFPWWSVDEDLRDLLEESDFIDGRLYAGGGQVERDGDEDKWWEGQIERGLEIADDITPTGSTTAGIDYMARVWLQDNKTENALKTASYLETFFTEATLGGVVNASVDLGRHQFECGCQIDATTPGQMWNDLVVQAAKDAAYLPNSASKAPAHVSIVSVTPSSATQGQTNLELTFRGTEFSSPTVALAGGGTGWTIGAATDVTSTSFKVVVSVPQIASTGTYDWVVTDGGDSWTLHDWFEVHQNSTDAPAPSGFIGSDGTERSDCMGNHKIETSGVMSTYLVTLGGRHFDELCTLDYNAALLPSGVTIGNDTWIDSGRFQFNVTVTAAATATKGSPVKIPLTIENPDMQSSQMWTLVIQNEVPD